MTTRTIREAARLRVEALYNVRGCELESGPLVTIGQISGNGPWRVVYSALQAAPTVLTMRAAFDGTATLTRGPDRNGFEPIGDAPSDWLTARTGGCDPVDVNRLPAIVIDDIADVITAELTRLERKAQGRKGGI